MSDRNVYINIKWLIACCCLGMLYGCGRVVKAEPAQPKHWAEVTQKGTGRFYMDQVPVEKVMKVTGTGSTRFICYQVGFEDEIMITDKAKLQERGKYFQYDMQKDWLLKLKEDSLKPVFFQPSVKMDRNINEGVLVFEVPAGQVPDTLIYRDAFGAWGVQKIILNSH